MTGVRDRDDFGAQIRGITRRIRDLETATPLASSSITVGKGLAVKVPSGVTLSDGGSVVAGAAAIDSADGGKVGAGGTSILSTGTVTNTGGLLKVDVGVDSAGRVEGRMGVIAPVDGTRTELGDATHKLRTRAGALENRAGDLEARAGATENDVNRLEARAGALENRADSHASRIGAVENDAARAQSSANQALNENDQQNENIIALISRVNVLTAQVIDLDDRVEELENDGGGPKG